MLKTIMTSNIKLLLFTSFLALVSSRSANQAVTAESSTVVSPLSSTSEIKDSPAALVSKNGQNKVQKRSYYYSSPNSRNSVSLFEASSVWKPATYTISRPYYIPVYGVSGQVPIFYPPQSFYLNPGSPLDNPRKPPYQAPGYLPPKETPSSTTRPMELPNRFGEEDDDRPVWVDGESVPAALRPNENKEGSPVPTRAPVTRPAMPPLVHATESNVENAPSLIAAQFIRPPSQTTTIRPPPGPSNCVWAIISCCSAGNPKELSQNCFEQRGCPGPFWGPSPCESDFAKAAIDAAVKYYAKQ